ncbi:RND transporter, partial [Pseudomonas putida]|nr:RND transporter [Pseudomonas putida]MBI6960016.1 RND transporter [Pseudomonas putida]
MTLPSRISLLFLSLGLTACSLPTAPQSGITAPSTWQGETAQASAPSAQWWHAFASRELDRLVARAQRNAH